MVAFKKLILLRVAFNGLRFDLCLWLNYKNFMVYAQICYIGTSDKWLNLYSVLCNWYKLQSPWSFGLGLLFSVFKFFLFNVISLFLAALKRFPKRSSIPEEGPSAMLLHGSSWSVLGSCSWTVQFYHYFLKLLEEYFLLGSSGMYAEQCWQSIMLYGLTHDILT